MIDLTNPYGLSHPCVLMPLPCGCIIESTLRVELGIVICPWCTATFSAYDFGEWINSDSPPPIFLENGPKEMIRCHEGHLHEVCGEQSGMPVVRVGEELIRFSHFERVAH